MKAKAFVALSLALTIGFVGGFVAARQSSQPQTPSVEEIVKKVQDEIDASGRQVVVEVWAALQLLKDAVKDAPVPPAPMPELERKFAAVQERLSVAVETLLIQTFIGAIEKTTAVMPELNSSSLSASSNSSTLTATKFKTCAKKDSLGQASSSATGWLKHRANQQKKCSLPTQKKRHGQKWL